MKVLLIVNRYNPQAEALGREIARTLRAEGADSLTFYYDYNIGQFPPAERETLANQYAPDIAFSLGGDGTVLFAARELAPLGVPILPIHLGTTGFMSAAEGKGWRAVYQKWLSGAADISVRMMLLVQVERAGGVVFECVCLNDAVISSDGIAKVIRLNVKISGGAAQVNLGSFRSDGLIASSATGSTAYSAAAGGPILDPEMEAIILNPISPLTLSSRPIVLPAGQRIIVEVESEQRSGILLTIDGQVTEALKALDSLTILKAPRQASLVGSGRSVFYRALRGKLGWSGGE